MIGGSHGQQHTWAKRMHKAAAAAAAAQKDDEYKLRFWGQPSIDPSQLISAASRRWDLNATYTLKFADVDPYLTQAQRHADKDDEADKGVGCLLLQRLRRRQWR